MFSIIIMVEKHIFLYTTNPA